MKTLLASILLGTAIAAPAPPEPSNSACTNPRVRREWRTLSVDERKNYIRAVQCMMEKKPISKELFPIVRSRYEDFVALHVNATGGGVPLMNTHGLVSFGNNATQRQKMRDYGIHNAGIFLPWHRYMIWIWENTLRDECGWTEAQPYWDWHLDTPESGGEWLKSPIFDPVTGFGGNGEKVNITVPERPPFVPMPPAKNPSGHSHSHPQAPSPAGNPETRAPQGSDLPNLLSGLGIDTSNLANVIGNSPIMRPGGGTGGGCIQDGVFKDITLRIGPMGAMMPNSSRCLTRNINARLAEKAASKKTIRTILEAKTFAQLRNVIESPVMAVHRDPGNGTLHLRSMTASLHSVGHAGVGGEMADLFTSTNDPIFFLHHANLDRIWAMWQEMEIPGRLTDAEGGSQLQSMPSRTPIHLNTTIWVGFAGPDRPVRDVMDTQNRDNSGFLCYKYDKYVMG